MFMDFFVDCCKALNLNQVANTCIASLDFLIKLYLAENPITYLSGTEAKNMIIQINTGNSQKLSAWLLRDTLYKVSEYGIQYSCALCFESYTNLETLLKHCDNSKHQGKSVEKLKYCIKPIRCLSCKYFYDFSELRKHEHRIIDAHKISERNDINLHKKGIKHKSEKTKQRNQPPKKMHTIHYSSLSENISLVPCSFPCKKCNFKAGGASELQLHIHSVHEGLNI